MRSCFRKDAIYSKACIARKIAAGKAQGRIQLGEGNVSEKTASDKGKFDWIAARSACSLPKVYRDLMLGAEGDIKARNAERPDNAPYEFSIVEQGNTFAAILEAKDFRRSVTFQLEDHAILVLDNSGNQMFEVTLVFTEEGKCRMKAKEENREAWQIRRMALEDLMFRTI